jgi:pimeloyl-ACP methyl ester carboxylesterase
MNRTLDRGGAVLRVVDTGDGLPVIFQHGLGGDYAQVAKALPEGHRCLTVECRGHGGSSAGDARPFSIAMFADDVCAAIDAAGIDRFVIGGISMGAAIALRIAARQPDRVMGLALVRPAWLFDPAPETMRPNAEVAALLRAHPPAQGRALFLESQTGRFLAREAPDNLASLLGFFERPDTASIAALLGDIAADGPGVSEAEASAIGVPTLTIGCGHDYVHPLSYARRLAEMTRGRFVEVAPKATEAARHFADLRAALGIFFDTLAPERNT